MTIELSVEERWEAIEKNTWFLSSGEDIPPDKHYRVYPEGHGIYLRDDDGKEYIDATSGNWCTVLGHGNKKVIKAIEEQLEKVQYPTPGHSDASIRLSQKIAEVTPGDLNRVQLHLHGSDANEVALAIARAYFKRQGKFNSMIISRWHAYHGQTLGVAGLTTVGRRRLTSGLDLATVSHGTYPMFAPYCYRCSYGLEYPSCDVRCARALEDVLTFMRPDNVVAFMGEPVFGGGGNIAPVDEYWPVIRQICDKYGILLILDEVITGWGKTGKLFACEHWDIVPDIMVTAKGLTSAYLPLSAVIVREHVYKVFRKRGSPYYGHTHSGYPVGAACALAAIDVIMEEKLWENAAKVGAQIRKRLEKICQQSEIAGAVHGIGLMLGLEIVEDKASKKASLGATRTIMKKCEEKGVLLNLSGANGNILPVSPPMIITKEEADKLCDVLAEAIKETEAAGIKKES